MVAAKCAQAEIAPTISDANICIPILLCVPDPDYQLEVANFGNLTASAKVEQMGNIGRYLSERSTLASTSSITCTDAFLADCAE